MPIWNDSTVHSSNMPDREKSLRDELSGASSLPAGGTTGQVLAKSSSSDGDAGWVNAASGNFGQIRKITAGTTATSTDYKIQADATTAGVTVTLPAASANSGLELHIEKTDSSTHNVNIAPAGADTIQGATGNYVLRSQFGAIRFVSDGVSDWKRVDLAAPLARGSNKNNTDFYVDGTNGNDSYPGTHPSLAKKTIGAALNGYRTVHIATGLYTETVDVGNLYGLRLIGPSAYTDGLTVGAIVQAPTDSSSALVASGPCKVEIGNMSFVGAKLGGSTTYTGIVVDSSNMTIGCYLHDITIMGIAADFTGAKTIIGSGVYGGIGLQLGAAEQATYRNLDISNCRIGIQASAPGTTGQSPGTLSKLRLSDFHLGTCFIVHQETPGSWGDNIFSNFKTQNVFGLAFAIAQLSSNGSNPADGDTVLVRSVTYRFKSTMAQANDVQIGATIDATLLSLVKAVNGTGVAGTDYFAGTAQPTGVQAGWTNLVDYGASGGNHFTLGAVDTTHHACTFQVTDVLGPNGNAYTFTVTSANLSDYFGGGTFARAAWAIEIHEPNEWVSVDAMENIALPAGNAILIDSDTCYFNDFACAPQTQVSITGNMNYFLMPRFQNTVTVQTGAQTNIFDLPFNNTATAVTNASRITDNGTGTVIRMHGSTASSPIALTYGTSMTPNVYQGENFVITATNGTAFTINNPSVGASSDAVPGEKLSITIRNTSGGALGVATFGANYKLATWTQPANGFSRSIGFRYDGTNWIEISRTPADVPN